MKNQVCHIMKCEKENCGADIAPGAKFCSGCGTKVVAPTTVKKAICSCSNLVLEVHSFCLNCGLKVDSSLFTGTCNTCNGTKNNGEKCYIVLPPGTKFCPFCGTAATREDSGTTLEAASLKDNELSNQQKSSDNIKNIGENAKDQQEECAEKLDETTEQVIDDTRKEGKTLFISMYQNEIPSQTRDCKEVYRKVLQETEVKDAIDDTKLISGEEKVQDAADYTEMDSGECQRNNKKDETSKTAEDHFPCIQKSDVGNQSHTEKEFSQIKTLDIPAASEQKFLDLQRCGIKRSHEPDIVLVTEKRRKEFTTEKFPATENLNLIDTDACNSSNNDAIIIDDSKSESGDTKLSSGEENVDIDNITIKRKAEENKIETKRIKTEGKSVSTEDSKSAETEQFGIKKTGESITDELDEIQLNKTENKSNRDESHEVPKPEKANSLEESQDVTNTTTSNDEPNGNTESIKAKNKILTRSAAKAIKDATTKNEIGSQTKEDLSEKGKKEQEGSNKSTVKTIQQENSFKVFFHAIMHASVYDESCVTYVRFSLDVLGGWKSNRHELHPVRNLENGNIEVCGVVSIPRGFLDSSIWYKYFVVCGKVEQEEYNFNQQYNTRRLFVASKLMKTSAVVFHQYDGVVRGVETKESFFNFFNYLTGYEESQYKKFLAMDALESAKVFLPVWNTMTEPPGQAGPCMGEEMITAVNAVWRGLKRCYCKKKAVTEKGLASSFKEAIMGRLEDLYKDFVGRNYFTGEERKKIFINAVTVAYLLSEHGFSLSHDEATALCGALLPEMELEEKQNSCIENLKEIFPQTFKKIPVALVKLVHSLISISSPSWLYCMPLVHFLHQQCCPGEIADDNVKHDSNRPVWWGIADKDNYTCDLKKFKEKPIVSELLEDIMGKLEPYFKIDYLLQRTVMACLSLEQLPEVIKTGSISPDVILASVCFYVREEKNITKAGAKEEAIVKCFTTVRSQLCEDKKSDDFMRCAKRSFLIAADVLNSMFRRHDNKLTDNVMCLGLEIFLLSLHVYETMDKSLIDSTGKFTQMEIEKTLDDIQSKTRFWLKDKLLNYKNKELLPCLEFWNRMLTVAIPNGCIKNEFTIFIADALHETLPHMNLDEEFVKVYCQNKDLFSDEMLNILTKYAFDAVVKCTDFSYRKWKDGQLINFGQLLSAVFETSILEENLKDTSSVLKFLLNCSPFPLYVKMCNDNKHSTYLSKICLDKMKEFCNCIGKVVDDIVNRTVSITNFGVVGEKKDHFCNIVKDIRSLDSKDLKNAIELRLVEIEAYNECLRNLKKFIDICQRCNANTLKLEEEIKRLQDSVDVTLKDICEQVAVPKHIKKYQPEVTAFKIDGEILAMLPEMSKCAMGTLFLTLWDKHAAEASREKTRPLEIPELMNKVWKPTFQHLKRFHQNVKNGEISFKEFDSMCGRYDSDTLKKELRILEGVGKKGSQSVNWIKERIQQMNKYKNLQCCLDGASVIIEVVEEYELGGDFQAIHQILQLTHGKDIKMNKLKDSHLKTCSVLSDIDGKKIDCLQKFRDSKILVNWLKEKMPGEMNYKHKYGLQELKVFVDLAYISTGDDPMQIAKVRCLQSAAIGYAPLIFNLNDDCDCTIFLDRCQEVWNALASNPNLPKELEDTCRELEWLKVVEESHGSVEVTSLAQAEAINARGTYYIGSLKKENEEHNCQLSNIMELRVAEKKEGENLLRNYSYEQLHDLQSRLMLVAGKAEMGKDDVDRFIHILDSVVRLCNVYIKLLSSGCVLFSKFQVIFRCDPTSRVCAFVTFGEKEEKQTLRGKTDPVNKDVSFFIPKIAKFLEQCHERWLEFIDSKREENYILNFITIEQMVILQQELVKLGTAAEPSNLVYPILSVVKRDCTREDLVKAMEEAQLELEKMDVDIVEEEKQEVPMEEDNSEAAVARFIIQLIDAGNSERLAREALKHVNPDQIDEGIAWCIEHGDDEMETEPSSLSSGSVTEQENQFTGWSTQNISMASVRSQLLESIGVGKLHGIEDSVDDLIEKLEKLWKGFATSISSSVSDYLSVEHLALILRKLADMEVVTVERSFSVCGYKEGVPNLIVCPQSEMYNTVLSIYSTEDHSPLPQSDEVLLCTQNTTLDMLEIFWRRSLFSDGNKIYCLVNTDLLDYEVSDKGEKSLERHMKNAQNIGALYKLVVFCSTENEYKSRMVAALDKYRQPQLTFGGEKHVKKFLAQRFKVDKLVNGVEPASFADFDRSSVRVVKSWRAGIGKSLFKRNMATTLMEKQSAMDTNEDCVVSIPLYDRNIVIDEVMDVLLTHIHSPQTKLPRIFHFDISHEVQDGVDAFLFQLLVLGCLCHSSGYVWRKSELDYYIIESMPLLARDSDTHAGKLKCIHHCLDILPEVLCRSPTESMEILGQDYPQDYHDSDLIFDENEFASEVFQRPYQYLTRLDRNEDLNDIDPEEPEGDRESCLKTLLRHCSVKDPSWSELYHFVSFLNRQLQDFETSSFCNPLVIQDLPGFPSFVLNFMIQMSKDFATRSLMISEESPIDMLRNQLIDEDADEEDIEQLYEMRRTWETSPHPYLFFNPDHHTMTFLGFNIEKSTGNLIDEQTGDILQERIMEPTLYNGQPTLYNGLNAQPGVNLSENFDQLSRSDKIQKLCRVMGIEFPHDPDPTYELTKDNVKKILAIYMRFRCDIPVIIMGETGCGKTRLIKFMCSLQCLPGEPVKNMIIMKVHGGTTTKDIMNKVRKAEEMAKNNAEENSNMFTVLFFDEANTTEAIGVIKEIMCDKSLGGQPIQIHERLKLIAACNPYRKHKEELIKKLEQAGLGYHVDADKTTDRLGRVPMRRLVYRVQPLPQSMLPLVWDFGQLNNTVEEMYIRQMVIRYVNDGKLPKIEGLAEVTSRTLSACQDFMRNQEDECSFVSLRDVERVLEVMTWFYRQTEEGGLLFDMETAYDDDAENINITRSFILALSVCYQACLKKREDFRDMVVDYFEEPLVLQDENQLETELTRCQNKFLDNVKLADNIARNQALKENLFMMIVCIDLRIPLFLVGKPGSSKSLAKTIVADAMQGDTARSLLFKRFKQVQMVSFQCSPLSTPDGIMGTFKQCAEFQKAKDLDRFVSVVVLDEIGLAEDSPKMPLKTLHPLLEDGCQGDDEPEDFMKVAFIGISNWALDPAKMNRGIFVQREVPDEEELINSAKGICRTSKDEDRILKLIENLIPSLAKSYKQLFTETEISKREFFGLRDFYSLIKMVYGFAAKTEHKPTWLQLKHAIMRNFGGLDNVKSVDIFRQHLRDTTVVLEEIKVEGDPDCSSAGMIQACLQGDSSSSSETRYLLLLTENYGDLAILQQKITTMHNPVVIFGSSFPSDQEYTQVCRNINRIKVCMETGSTVILLNLENLYESLYDALNQYYVLYGGERYVDLGLGSHRVKCKVHKSFRLIVVAEKEIVYKKFPIPLINRLEKHVLSLSTMLSEVQLILVGKLEEWVKDFCHVEINSPWLNRDRNRKMWDVFIGYHPDTCAAIIMQIFEERKCNQEDLQQSVAQEILLDAKNTLLWCAAPDAIIRLKSTKLRDSLDEMIHIYCKQQQHESLLQYLSGKVKDRNTLYAQVTTYSKLLSSPDLHSLSESLKIQKQNITLLTLQSFDTEQQFCRQIRFSMDKNVDYQSLLIVQCDCGDQNADLIACARYSIQEEMRKISENCTGNVHVVLIVQLPRVAGNTFTGFQCGLWHSVHIDDLRPPKDTMPSFIEMYSKPVSAFLASATNKSEHKSVDLDGKTDEEMDVNEESDTSEKRSHIDILSLINNCVQSALALVKDPEKESSRTTERIKMILQLIQDSSEQGDKSFLSGIAVHLKSLLKEKEETESELYKEWLSIEASNPDHINRAGTFRRAAIQCLEEKLSKLLAGVIAFIDKNNNINIIVNEGSQKWQKYLWTEILNCPSATQLQYTDFLVSEFVVQGTAYEGGYFSGGMPFSWLIYRHIEDLLKNTSDDPQETLNSCDLVMKTASILESTPIGQLLLLIEGTDVQQVIRSYISDFVHMSYPVKSESEHLVICENTIIGCRQIIHGEIGRLFPALVGCHAAFQLNGTRFRNFSDIVYVWPECSEKTLRFQEVATQDMMYLVTTDEITLDLMGLHLLLSNLEPPTTEALHTYDSRKKWIKTLCDYRPVVERIFGCFTIDKDAFVSKLSARITQALQTARCLWTKALVLKLFIEHVCTEDSEVKRCKPLWVILKNKADLKKSQSLEKVEMFLKSCNKEVSSKLFSQQSCTFCKEKITAAPVTLPCVHTICRRCFDEAITSAVVKCPMCDEQFNKDFDPMPADQSENIRAYQDFRRRCNSFYMEIVSQLCFAEGTPPADEIIDKLLSYITVQTRKGQEVTKELTIFDDSIDPTPVVRSFLLQHLMQTSGEKVNLHLDNYFKKALRSVDPSENNLLQTHDLCILVLQCMEDACHRKYPETNKKQIDEATNMLRNGCKMISLGADQLLENMEHLAQCRFSLSIAANFMYKVYIDKSVKLDTHLKRLFEAVGKLCEGCGSAWPRRYFVKYLCRSYGTDSYQAIRMECDMAIQKWINLPELQRDKIEECSDRFIVCGEIYTQMREAFVKAALNQDEKQLIHLLQSKKNKWKTEFRFLLVVYREFTMNFLYEKPQQQFSDKIKQFLQRSLMNCHKIKDKELIQGLLTNSLWRRDGQRNIYPAMDLGQQGLSCLLVHCMMLFKLFPDKQTLLSPLLNLAIKPELMKESYFPTMPQDDLDEIKEALKAARPDGSENPVFYRCPNGHLYVIGDCGRPAVVDRCKTCGLQIGGELHVLLQGNVVDQGIDTTDTGHILGRVRNFNGESFPERKLNRANCAVMKLLTHMAMYIGANTNIQAVCKVIKPDIEEEEVSTYLIEHVQNDLRTLSRVLGKSKEDIMILIHHLLHNIVDNLGSREDEDTCFLKNKKSRANWEEKFNQNYIAPLLKKSETILTTINEQIVNDSRLGADPLLQLLYETDTSVVHIANNLCENPSVWQFRERISLDNLMQTFARSEQKCPVLQQFLEEEPFLRAIRFVPSILRLQNMLIQKYNRKLDRKEASHLLMERVIMDFKNDPRCKELEACWMDFKQVWESIRQSLDRYGFPIKSNFVYLSKENSHKRIDDKTPLSYILPRSKDEGLCSYSLLFFLLEKQNLFLQKYCQESKMKYDSLPKVHVQDISSAHLISYHPDRDLLPMVLANCNYSFEVGQGTKVEYSFTNLERQLIDRLLFTKSVILLKEIDTVVYRSEITNAVVFLNLRDRIRQERLSSAICAQIQSELHQKTFPDLCDSIDKLDIAISFLKSVGSTPESMLNDFMVNTLKIDNPFVSLKAQQTCRCKHVQSLWITLALEKNQRLEKSSKESFDGLSSIFKQKLLDDQSDALNHSLSILQVEQLDILLQTLFECIVLVVDIPQKDEESVDMSKVSLSEALLGYLYDPPYISEAPTPDWLTDLAKQLPNDVLCSQVIETWIIVHELFLEKQNEK